MTLTDVGPPRRLTKRMGGETLTLQRAHVNGQEESVRPWS